MSHETKLLRQVSDLVVSLDRVGPGVLGKVASSLTEYAGDFANPASKRRLAHDVARLLEKEAKR